jgi:hypothetical protein
MSEFHTIVNRRLVLPAKSVCWPDGTFAIPEARAGGVALLDYDNDGRLD